MRNVRNGSLRQNLRQTLPGLGSMEKHANIVCADHHFTLWAWSMTIPAAPVFLIPYPRRRASRGLGWALFLLVGLAPGLQAADPPLPEDVSPSSPSIRDEFARK